MSPPTITLAYFCDVFVSVVFSGMGNTAELKEDVRRIGAKVLKVSDGDVLEVEFSPESPFFASLVTDLDNYFAGYGQPGFATDLVDKPSNYGLRSKWSSTTLTETRKPTGWRETERLRREHGSSSSVSLAVRSTGRTYSDETARRPRSSLVAT
jgi:hypothetical protein